MAPDGGWSRAPLDTAAEYAALGLAVIPECPPTCSCNSPGKRPFDPVAGRHLDGWQGRGVPTVADLDAWLSAPAAQHVNIGCRCGPGCLGADGLIGADADGGVGVADLGRHLGLAPGALEAALAEYLVSGIFAANLGTAAYVTQSGGLRALWRAPAGTDLRTVGGDRGHDGLRLMWEGSQVVLPPSVGPAGTYRWLPGHSPWQVGFEDAPASIVAAMSGKSRTATRASVVLLPTAAYVAATGNLGPDQNGRLADASRLPYDLGLLRDGVPQGQRSEVVRRLELQILAAGWTVEQVVAALAGQPWIAAMRPHILGWLTADVLRAQAWRAEQDAQAVGGAASGEPGFLWTTTRGPRWRPVPSRQDPLTAPEPAPTPNLPAGWQEEALRALAEALAPHLADPTFDLDEAVAIALADATDPDRLDAGLRQAVAEACARWVAQQAAAATGGGQPPKDPGDAGGAATQEPSDDESAERSNPIARKRRGPPAGATVLSPSEEELGRCRSRNRTRGSLPNANPCWLAPENVRVGIRANRSTGVMAPIFRTLRARQAGLLIPERLDALG